MIGLALGEALAGPLARTGLPGTIDEQPHGVFPRQGVAVLDDRDRPELPLHIAAGVDELLELLVRCLELVDEVILEIDTPVGRPLPAGHPVRTSRHQGHASRQNRGRNKSLVDLDRRRHDGERPEAGGDAGDRELRGTEPTLLERDNVGAAGDSQVIERTRSDKLPRRQRSRRIRVESLQVDTCARRITGHRHGVRNRRHCRRDPGVGRQIPFGADGKIKGFEVAPVVGELEDLRHLGFGPAYPRRPPHEPAASRDGQQQRDRAHHQ